MQYFFGILSGLLFYKLFQLFLRDKVLDNYIEKLILKSTLKELPDLIKGKTGYAKNLNINIFYEDLCNNDNPKSTVILINGSFESLIQWPKELINNLLENGLRVVRFDNRGQGLSDWIIKWSKSKSYNLNDMALDTISVANHLKIEKFHVIGYSMGGMISQILAINYPEKILSLTSLMSSAHLFDPESEKPDFFRVSQLRAMIYGYKNRKNELKKALKFHFKLSHLWVGKDKNIHNFDEQLEKVLFEIKKRNGYNKQVFFQHRRAIKNSGSRYSKLKKIKNPTLIIHGSDDPLIKISHAKKMASLIHGCKFEIVLGMGHDFHKNFKNRINSIILPHILRNC